MPHPVRVDPSSRLEEVRGSVKSHHHQGLGRLGEGLREVAWAEDGVVEAVEDPEKPFVTSGIRLGTPAGTTRGFGEAEFKEIGGMIAEVVEGLRKNGEAGDGQVEQSVAARVRDLCARFPIYQG